mgnify:CR=1 FL=1
MDRQTEYRVQQVSEDAAEGGTVVVPVPPKAWSCGDCGQRAINGREMHCTWCGKDREEVEL